MLGMMRVNQKEQYGSAVWCVVMYAAFIWPHVRQEPGQPWAMEGAHGASGQGALLRQVGPEGQTRERHV